MTHRGELDDPEPLRRADPQPATRPATKPSVAVAAGRTLAKIDTVIYDT